MSNGLETIFDEKRVTSQNDIFDFLQITLEQQLGPADSVALSNAYDCATNNDLLGIALVHNNLGTVYMEIGESSPQQQQGYGSSFDYSCKKHE